MRHEESIETLLQQVTLKPPTPKLEQAVLRAIEQAESSGEVIGHRLSLGWWGAIAACLAMVLLTHWYCERQLKRWTRPVYSQPLPQRAPAVFEDLGWEMQSGHWVRFSRTSVLGGERKAGNYRNHLRQLLEESRHSFLEESQGDLPDGQSRNTVLGTPGPYPQMS